jgi:hypothetical protein
MVVVRVLARVTVTVLVAVAFIVGNSEFAIETRCCGDNSRTLGHRFASKPGAETDAP